ncbi:hypothetical protein [Teichococcus wenyumeiae]|uniref:hypothetical protein n=1 Tax=Teichococcus wenyumeiae TaxID=2478470 RepID=UPI0011C38FBD|nr:hypothetical protein [Pseudoroseomonas wenyumeiae]
MSKLPVMGAAMAEALVAIAKAVPRTSDLKFRIETSFVCMRALHGGEPPRCRTANAVPQKKCWQFNYLKFRAITVVKNFDMRRKLDCKIKLRYRHGFTLLADLAITMLFPRM